MQPLPSFLPTHAGDSVQTVGELLELQLPTPAYWTSFDIPVTTPSPLARTWTPRPFKVSGLDTAQGSVENVSVEIADADGFLALQDLGTASLVGTRVIVRRLWLDPYAPLTVLGTVVLFDGQIDVPTYSESVATFSLRGPVRLGGRMFPAFKCGATCPYVFTGPACGYSLSGGATSCDRSYADCVAKGGTQATRFGGMRSIPAPGTHIVWGDGGFTLGAATK